MLKLELYCTIMVIILFITGCKKDKTEDENTFIPPNQMEFWNCHTQTVWHMESVFNELVGKWKWIYSESYWAPGEGLNTEDENTILEFQSDSVLNVYVDGNLTGTTNWSIILTDPPLFGLAMDSTIAQLYGRILFCNEIVEFNNSYIDGDDNYFKRIE